MLFVVVAEYFICWTPMYVLQTWFVFDHSGAVRRVSPSAMNLVHLLGFASACCHPITYGFMNASFRRGFAAVFCRRLRRRWLTGTAAGLSALDDDVGGRAMSLARAGGRQLACSYVEHHAGGARPNTQRNCHAL